jgi:predicted nucleic acid-binding protein
MIAIDTSALAAFLNDEHSWAASAVEEALDQQCAVFPPVVLTEILSASGLKGEIVSVLLQIPLLTVTSDYWANAGRLRSKITGLGRKARLADCLIAQSCLDHQVPLITLDRDFQVFEKFGGLQLVR